MYRPIQRTCFEQRLAIADRAQQACNDTQIAQQLGYSVWTVRKWRRRFRDGGRNGLISHLGRPPTGPLGTMAPELMTALRQLRTAHPGWGPNTLLAALRTDAYWRTQRLPSRSRLAVWLKHTALARPYRRRVALPQPPLTVAVAPHEEWQMDAQGPALVEGLGQTSVINVIDVVSRLKVESCPRAACYKPAADDYFLSLRRAFVTFGLPKRISLDHDTVFFDNTTPSPFPTRLHLWLIALNIEVVFIRKRRPTGHALVERNHQTMFHQGIEGQSWSVEQQLWRGLDERREGLNNVLSVRSLGRQAPLEAYPEAHFSRRAYRPQWEEELLDMELVYQYLAQDRWFRPLQIGRFRLGAHNYIIGKRFREQTLEIGFDAGEGLFVCRAETGEELVRIAPQGLTKQYLMGELAELQMLPAYQLMLPWTAAERRQAELAALSRLN